MLNTAAIFRITDGLTRRQFTSSYSLSWVWAARLAIRYNQRGATHVISLFFEIRIISVDCHARRQLSNPEIEDGSDYFAIIGAHQLLFAKFATVAIANHVTAQISLAIIQYQNSVCPVLRLGCDMAVKKEAVPAPLYQTFADTVDRCVWCEGCYNSVSLKNLK
jgi:hypothetical protein